ncbi:P-loop NTPase fold protein [Bacillus paranthracis]
MQRKTANVQLVKPVETADEYEELFKEEIEKYKKKNSRFQKLIVIVDDLDRLSPRKVVDALDAIKAFVDVDECIFIVACDENILIQALEKEKLNKSAEHIDGELFFG